MVKNKNPKEFYQKLLSEAETKVDIFLLNRSTVFSGTEARSTTLSRVIRRKRPPPPKRGAGRNPYPKKRKNPGDNRRPEGKHLNIRGKRKMHDYILKYGYV